MLADKAYPSWTAEQRGGPLIQGILSPSVQLRLAREMPTFDDALQLAIQLLSVKMAQKHLHNQLHHREATAMAVPPDCFMYRGHRHKRSPETGFQHYSSQTWRNEKEIQGIGPAKNWVGYKRLKATAATTRSRPNLLELQRTWTFAKSLPPADTSGKMRASGYRSIFLEQISLWNIASSIYWTTYTLT